MAAAQIADIIGDWDDLIKDYREFEDTHGHYMKKYEEMTGLQRQCQSLLTAQQKQLKTLQTKMKGASPVAGAEEEKRDQLITKRKQQLKNIEETLPKKNGMYLNVILGDVNTSLLNKADRFKYKEQYEHFKLVLTVLSLCLSIVALIFDYRVIDRLLDYLLVWYYCMVTIRESILRINGSHIKGWWLTHHYITAVQGGIIVTWPEDEPYEAFRVQFMWFALYLSIVQLCQYRYQKGCLYRLRALGERHNMDVTVDGFHVWMWRGLGFLLPFLFFGYFFQLYNAYTLYQLSYHPAADWQVPVTACIFFILAIGNILTTTQVLQLKLRQRLQQKFWPSDSKNPENLCKSG
ncbi:PREDICTED: transmembrane protein 120 homolog isoform X1 [Priapulus caudatus]|uniref:Transmembrane protein 120 homolog isoform X1 n=1 Tax=Priapulus caudatus TaxID=37621 RepID=A0ABM1DYE1_PRICU|nr:PREDICTED: transmembrane protein 120 homolog isoform X1 [Priapulus caudatus]XP_014664962.1 PREDICTED: transmembrane protein 120 homolog isoform X1 [Priapulus caudatus]